MKIAFDIHGVLDTNPKFFSELTTLLKENGHEVHLLTGSHIDNKLLKYVGVKLNISYTHIFSITDYHVQKGTGVKFDKQGHPWLDPYEWDKSKAEYCARNNIDLCLDDSDTYAYFFKTPYARFMSRSSTRVRKMHI
jgi:uncharacterized Fe-S cluster protein YjdI